MTTVSRTNQVSHSTVTSGSGGTGGGDWDHRLNNLLHDLQESVIPEESRRGGSEYREYRMTSSTRNNDDPPSNTEEKWIEYGTKNGHGYERAPILDSGYGAGNTSSSSRSKFESSSEKTVGFSDRFGSGGGRSYGVDSGLTSGSTRTPQIEFMTPLNTTTVLKSGPTSPGGIEPKVDRKEFYAKASYTTLIKGGPGGEFVPETNRDRIMEDLLPPKDYQPMQSPRPAITSSSSTSESRREFMESQQHTRGTTATGGYRCPAADILAQQQPLYSSTPLKTSSSYSKEMMTTMDRSITPPPRPVEGLKTPPMIRKILQQSTSAYDKSSYESNKSSRQVTTGTPIPIQQGPIPYYDDTVGQQTGTQYYSARTTRNETRERDMSPARRFPSPQPPRYDNEPPKHLDDLLATFDESYTHSSRITGDGGGPHKSHPYGPGTHQIRTVRIDDKRSIIDSENELVQRKPAYDNGHVAKSSNVSGPPVFYPPGQMFNKTEEEALMAGAGKGKSKAKMDRQWKGKESSKQKHSEKDGGGAVPVPVCLPVCCAAPCVIQ